MYRLLFDSESNGFVKNATKVHCIGAVDVDTRECLDWLPDIIGRAVETLDKADVLIGHNIQRHDIPLLTKITGWKPRPGVVIRDTMVCSRLIYPNVKDTDTSLLEKGVMPRGKKYYGKNTIGAWGYRLGCPKGDYAEAREAEARAQGITDPEALIEYVWGSWNQDMHDYMLQDVQTNLALWDKLKVDQYSQPAIELEHRIAIICDQMEQAGVPFNEKSAGLLHAELLSKRDEIERRLIDTFGTWVAPISPDPSKYTARPKRKPNKNQDYFWWDVVPGETVVGDDGRTYPLVPSYSKLKPVVFNPGSRSHIAKVLMAKGWKPEKMTPGGEPQIDEETVSGIVERYPEMAGLGQYLMVEKRLSQLVEGKQAWLKAVDADGLVHGVINPMGTTTSRASHFNPNLGQVPNAASPYGPECRALFYARKGWKVVGADMSGLELRALAHYLHPLDGGKYSAVVLDGDVHWYHANVMRLADGERDKHNPLHTVIREDGSKRFIYAYIYGCWDEMAGNIIFGCVNKARLMCGAAGEAVYARFFGQNTDPGERALKRVGKDVRDSFLTRIDGFQKLKDRISEQVNRFGWIPGLDNRRIPIRSDHSALNFMLQSAGAILCKRWVCDSWDALLASGLKHGWDGDFVLGLWVHDEIQVWVREGLEEKVSTILKACASKAGEPYGFRVRLDSEAKVGLTWRDTH